MVERHLAKVEVAGSIPVSRSLRMDITATNFKSLPHSRVRLSFTVSAADVQTEYRATITHYKRTVELRGFRKGHVPEQMILQRFADDLRRDALDRTVGAAIQEVLRGHDTYQLLEYDPPRITRDPKYDPQSALKVEVEFDTLPRPTLPAYDGMEVRIPEFVADDAAIENELTQLQQKRALYHPRGEQDGVEQGDALVIDLRDSDGNTRSDVRFVIGEQNAPPFALKLLGMRAGEEKEITADAAPADAAPAPAAPADAAAAGTATLYATVKTIQRRELPAIDDTFAKQINEQFTSLDDLRAAIRHELEAHNHTRREQSKRTRFVAQMAERVKIAPPLSMVEMEKQYMWRHLLKQYGMTDEQMQETLAREERSKEDLFNDWDGDTIRRLCGTLVVRELQRQESISVQSADIDAFITARAAASGHDLQTLKKLYTDNKQMGQVIEECAEELLFKRLFEKVTFKVDKTLPIN